MPNKYPTKKGSNLSKQKYKVKNWSTYNNALRNRGAIEVWISDEVINTWYEKERIYNGTGAPKKSTDLSIITYHFLRNKATV